MWSDRFVSHSLSWIAKYLSFYSSWLRNEKSCTVPLSIRKNQACSWIDSGLNERYDAVESDVKIYNDKIISASSIKRKWHNLFFCSITLFVSDGLSYPRPKLIMILLIIMLHLLYNFKIICIMSRCPVRWIISDKLM